MASAVTHRRSTTARLSLWRRVRRRLSGLLLHLAERLDVRLPASGPAPRSLPSPKLVATAAELEATACPALRPPLSAEDAVLGRDLSVLRREAADALAAFGAAHALISSARLAQLQAVQNQIERQRGEGGPPEELVHAARDYQGWQSDQVRLFDALNLVIQMRIPAGRALEQVPDELQSQARQHLQSLSTEYQRGLLVRQMAADEQESSGSDDASATDDAPADERD
ncbi:hypothetical protein EVJ50_02535 [Synechococcus sp. RSCCF101]|uniref:hypothetical protein n=1 Tax=Synechococcus sp. RSCCF101 TaxID=2511069 RepID=UPI0012467435|nr:hypothetical protein [Synechococcus sp. RSCCF101]QEY31289.1 hypothetical protein EVJ50_02535 [Synechococcus sp. RSCCF101]